MSPVAVRATWAALVAGAFILAFAIVPAKGSNQATPRATADVVGESATSGANVTGATASAALALGPARAIPVIAAPRRHRIRHRTTHRATTAPRVTATPTVTATQTATPPPTYTPPPQPTYTPPVQTSTPAKPKQTTPSNPASPPPSTTFDSTG